MLWRFSSSLWIVQGYDTIHVYTSHRSVCVFFSLTKSVGMLVSEATLKIVSKLFPFFGDAKESEGCKIAIGNMAFDVIGFENLCFPVGNKFYFRQNAFHFISYRSSCLRFFFLFSFCLFFTFFSFLFFHLDLTLTGGMSWVCVCELFAISCLCVHNTHFFFYLTFYVCYALRSKAQFFALLYFTYYNWCHGMTWLQRKHTSKTPIRHGKKKRGEQQTSNVSE